MPGPVAGDFVATAPGGSQGNATAAIATTATTADSSQLALSECQNQRVPKIPPTVREIAADLTDRIKSGEYPPGTRLPPARELADLYGVSVASVQRATTLLHERGLTIGRPGLGVYVLAS